MVIDRCSPAIAGIWNLIQYREMDDVEGIIKIDPLLEELHQKKIHVLFYACYRGGCGMLIKFPHGDLAPYVLSRGKAGVGIPFIHETNQLKWTNI